jgi:RNA polymerase sigma factor (TIGR02999 family)
LKTESITQLLQGAAEGHKPSMDRLMPLVYAELKRMAGASLRDEKPGHTLQPTALVHEAYVRMLGPHQGGCRSRAQFLAFAATVMRQILIDHARIKKAAKRGGEREKLTLEETLQSTGERPDAMLELGFALDALEKTDALKARLIEMKFFGGLTLEETAEITGLTVDSVRYQLRVAQAFLHRELYPK